MHDLIHEFPNLTDKIDKLKTNNATFAQLMKEYDELDARIRDLEELGRPVADETLEDLKKERLQRKDRLYAFLKE
jgi:uncharacterized protein YdcH (DUF465 family)